MRQSRGRWPRVRFPQTKMGKPYTSIGTFTARTTWGDVQVPITERVILFGIRGFAAHRELSRQGFTPHFVVSHIVSGRKVPGDHGRTSREAVRRCLDMLTEMEIS